MYPLRAIPFQMLAISLKSLFLTWIPFQSNLQNVLLSTKVNVEVAKEQVDPLARSAAENVYTCKILK